MPGRADASNERSTGTLEPLFRRATAADALELARSTFLANERVDLHVLAARLGVARTTLHRWFGTREHILDMVLQGLADEFVDVAIAESTMSGEERVIDVSIRNVGITARVEGARGFAEREPELALRLLIGARYGVHRRLIERLQALIEEELPDEAPRLAGFVQATVQVGTTLEWSSLVAGDEPDPEQIGEIFRSLLLGAREGVLGSHAAGARSGSKEKAQRPTRRRRKLDHPVRG